MLTVLEKLEMKKGMTLKTCSTHYTTVPLTMFLLSFHFHCWQAFWLYSV